MFEGRLTRPDGLEVTTSGPSVKKAEQMAAKKALGDIREACDP